jgi:hypothetical protein
MAFQLFQMVRVTRDLPHDGVAEGATGAVVDLLDGLGEAYEIEIVDAEGRTTFLGAIPREHLAAL